MSEQHPTVTLQRAMPPFPDIHAADMTWRAERPLGIAKIQIYGHDPDARFRHILGSIPAASQRQVEQDGITHAWLAPGEWLLTGEEAAVAALLARIDASGGDEVLAVNLTHARNAFLLIGTGARTALSAHCPLDLWEGHFPVGAVARSLLGEAGMFIARLDDLAEGPRFRIIFDQTMAAYVTRMMTGATPPGAFS